MTQKDNELFFDKGMNNGYIYSVLKYISQPIGKAKLRRFMHGTNHMKN